MVKVFSHAQAHGVRLLCGQFGHTTMRSLDMRLLGLMLATAGCGVHAVQFSNAADMRAKMEAEVHERCADDVLTCVF